MKIRCFQEIANKTHICFYVANKRNWMCWEFFMTYVARKFAQSDCEQNPLCDFIGMQRYTQHFMHQVRIVIILHFYIRFQYIHLNFKPAELEMFFAYLKPLLHKTQFCSIVRMRILRPENINLCLDFLKHQTIPSVFITPQHSGKAEL